MDGPRGRVLGDRNANAALRRALQPWFGEPVSGQTLPGSSCQDVLDALDGDAVYHAQLTE